MVYSFELRIVALYPVAPMSLFPDKIRHVMRSSKDAGGNNAGSSRALDFALPIDNLYAFAKMWSTLADRPVLSSFHGVMFANIAGRKSIPLFGYAGTGLFQSKILTNGHVRLRGKETGFFTDLASGEVLRHWHNPFTGQIVEVFNFLNDRVRGELTTQMPRFAFGAPEDEATLMIAGGTDAAADKVPFILPWECYGDRVHLGWDYCHGYRNPVSKDRWPSASTGDFINPSEHFYFTTSLQELADRDSPSAKYTAGFSRMSPWWPWMLMGDSDVDGVLFGRMVSVKSEGRPEDVPRSVYEYVEKHHADYLESPTDWDDGQPLGTWEAYAKAMPDEV
ncbi:MAG: DUF1838 domain-containing protein [Gammaproteobacteria bacterium]|nr:DUF1838 domain-containing protein [Gammaproteobacteria bacterium]